MGWFWAVWWSWVVLICCGRWAAGLAGCGVGRCWRWAAGCCEVWQGWQAVGAVQVWQGWRWCVVIVGGGLLLAWSSGAALAVLIHAGAGGGRNIQVLRPALPGSFPAFPRGGCRQHPARAGVLIRQAAGLEDGQKKKARAGGAVCAAALAFGLRWRGGAAPGASRCRWWAVVVCSPVPVPVRCWHWH